MSVDKLIEDTKKAYGKACADIFYCELMYQSRNDADWLRWKYEAEERRDKLDATLRSLI
jgi:hypothetical protein